MSRELFDTVQSMFDRNKRATTRTPRAGRHYLLAGRMCCGVCGRRMPGQWNHGRAYYRCKFTDAYPGGDREHPRNVYVNEETVVSGLDSWLGQLFDDDHIDDTCDHLAGVSEPDPAIEERQAALRAAIADCDRKLANYRALLDHDDAVTVAASWIAATQRERKNLERQLGQQVPGDQLTAEQVKALVTALKDIVTVLAEAQPADKSELYDQLGISLAYDPDGTVTVESQPRGLQVRVGGGTTPGTSWVLAQFRPRSAPSSGISRTAASHTWMVTSVSFVVRILEALDTRNRRTRGCPEFRGTSVAARVLVRRPPHLRMPV